MKSSQRHLHNFLLKTLCPLSPLSLCERSIFLREKRPLNSTQYSIVRPLPHINATRNVGNNVQFYFNQRGNFERTIRTSDDHCQSVSQSASLSHSNQYSELTSDTYSRSIKHSALIIFITREHISTLIRTGGRDTVSQCLISGLLQIG